MDNNNVYTGSTTPLNATSLVIAGGYIAITNVLAFTNAITLDDVQKIAAIAASVIVTTITILTYLRNRKRKR